MDKYTGYKLRVAASTTVGESSLSEEDDIFAFTLEDGMECPPWLQLSYIAPVSADVNILTVKDFLCLLPKFSCRYSVGDFFLSIPSLEPDSPPVNLTVEDSSSTTATLVWSPPEKANGVIQQYEVMYENESYSASVTSSSNRITLTNLKPFSYYNVSVRAHTRYGHGNQTSDTLYLLSGEDGVL